MDTNSRKKNTDNFHIDRQDFLFSHEDETRDIIIGKYNTHPYEISSEYRCCPYSLQSGKYDQQNESDEYSDDQENTFADCNEDDYINQNIINPSPDNQIESQYTFEDMKYLFKNYKIVHVPLYYYPFRNEFVESQYYIFYFDVDNPFIHICPACLTNFHDNKIYVLDNIVILCSKCYNQKNIIQSV